jgi:ketosteroid isomerase-like protein
MRPTPVITLALAALAGACQPAPPAGLTDADRAAVDSMAHAFTQMAIAGDYAGLVKMYYADDAVLMPPNMPAASGHAAIEAAFRTFPPITTFTIRSEELVGSGDLVYSRGRYNMVFAPPGMAAIPDSGKFLEILRKQADGSWKSTRDMFNSDVPLPPPPADASKKP